jgi:hypothetical protein
VSTNGTIVRSRTSPFSASDPVHLNQGPAYPLKPWDTIELHEGVVLSRADRSLTRTAGGGPGSVMGDAPTIYMPPSV